MSLASSAENPYFTGIEKISFLYLLTSAAQASSLPFRHSRTRRASVHSTLAIPRAGTVLSICSTASATLTGIELFYIPQSVWVENRRPKVSNAISSAHENVRTHETDHGKIVGHDFLDAIVKLFTLGVIERRELLFH